MARIKHPRFRHTFLIIGSLLVVGFLIATDPKARLIQLGFGAGVIVYLQSLFKAIWALALLHAGRKALFDYLDLETLLKAAQVTPDGAGKAMIGVGLFSIAIAICIAASIFGS